MKTICTICKNAMTVYSDAEFECKCGKYKVIMFRQTKSAEYFYCDNYTLYVVVDMEHYGELYYDKNRNEYLDNYNYQVFNTKKEFKLIKEAFLKQDSKLIKKIVALT